MVGCSDSRHKTVGGIRLELWKKLKKCNYFECMYMLYYISPRPLRPVVLCVYIFIFCFKISTFKKWFYNLQGWFSFLSTPSDFWASILIRKSLTPNYGRILPPSGIISIPVVYRIYYGWMSNYRPIRNNVLLSQIISIFFCKKIHLFNMF